MLLPSLPPRCLLSCRYQPVAPNSAGIPKEWNFNSFAISCQCGNNQLRVLGYWYESEFTGPIAFLCPSCEVICELMDPEKDGYNGEIGGNSTICGTGPRSEWRCSECNLNEGEIVASFGYQYETNEEETRRQDFFDAFILTHICKRNGKPIQITVFDCA